MEGSVVKKNHTVNKLSKIRETF